MEWYDVLREEQETMINIDYQERILKFYTNRKSVANKLEKKVGKPTKIDTTNGKISGVYYVRNLTDDDIRPFLSKTITVGGFSLKNSSDNKIIEQED